MQPVEPVTTVRGPATLIKPRITVADSHPWHVRWPEVYSSSRGTLCTLRIVSTGTGFEIVMFTVSLYPSGSGGAATVRQVGGTVALQRYSRTLIHVTEPSAALLLIAARVDSSMVAQLPIETSR